METVIFLFFSRHWPFDLEICLGALGRTELNLTTFGSSRKIQLFFDSFSHRIFSDIIGEKNPSHILSLQAAEKPSFQ